MMKAQFLTCGTRNAKHKGEQQQLVAVEAKGLVRDESSALPFLAALRLVFRLRISTFRLQVGYE